MSNNQKLYIPKEKLEALRDRIIKAHRLMKNSADTSGMAEGLFKAHIAPIVNAYQPIISSLANHNSNIIYRARKCIDHKPFENIRELYNPPTPSGSASSKVNIPVLYGSTSIQTCLVEIGTKIGDKVCVANFGYSAIKDGDFWFVGQLSSFYRSQEQSRYLEAEKNVHRHFYVEQEVLNSLVFTDNLINEIFFELSSDIDNYALNKFLIDAIVNKITGKHNFNGVVFVSTRDSPGINFAIYGNAIENLEPMGVNLIKITRVDDYGIVGYRLLKGSRPHAGTGNLDWSAHK